MRIGDTQYALNPNTRERLFKYVENNFVSYEDTTESDGQVVTQISENPIIRFDIIELKHKNQNNLVNFFLTIISSIILI